MIRFLWRWLKRLVIAVVVIVVLLLLPVARNELMCRGTTDPNAAVYQPIVTDPAWQRSEARTLMTYPEWDIVHAYEDYAAVIDQSDPQDFGYLRSIFGFWGSLCDVTRMAAAHGGVDTPTKQMVYTIGVSFTAELLAKAAYEETIGRLVTWVRGPEHAPLDDVSARQAQDYATFLQQTPWYLWDFRQSAAELDSGNQGSLRDRERNLALGIEYRFKALYAGAIEAAVAATGNDALRMRSVVSGVAAERLAVLPGTVIVGEAPQGTVIETDRYRAFTELAVQIAAEGGTFVEIAGNDDILVTVLGSEPVLEGALSSRARQGADDYRHLVLLKVTALSDFLNGLEGSGLTLEHIHDY